MIISSNINSTPTDENYNALRSDLVANHRHTGSDGPQIDHSDLTHPPNNYPIVHEHKDIDEHIDANSAVHGKPSGVFIAGAVGGNNSVLSGYWIANSEYADDVNDDLFHDVDDSKWSFFHVSLSPKLSGVNAFSNGAVTGTTRMKNTSYNVNLTLRRGEFLAYFVSSKAIDSFVIGVRSTKTQSVPTGHIEFDWIAIGEVDQS